ncbi:MAG TPA: N-acetylmuramoyl-L-alanine amidase [Vicinamibacteria bacterium]|nr:N-acetylmuramoyl-L-alanine amidase [Vicinamibacteria bacterium]
MVLLEGERREATPVVRGGAELLPIGPLLPTLGISATTDARGGSVTLSFEGRQVILYDKKSLASVGGDLRLMSSPALLEEGGWLVPVDSLPRLLAPLLGTRAEWRAASRVLRVGNVPAPRVSVSTVVSGESVRVVLEASEKVPFRVGREEGRVTVGITRDLVDVSYAQERLTGGIVDRVQFLGGKDNLFAITLGRRFERLRSAEEEGPPFRLILDFMGPAPVAGSAPTPGPPPAAIPAEHGLRTVVIDPGHGGGLVGAQGPGGALEKDVTLAIARKLRSAVANGLGLQAFLTRDGDQDVPLDDRAAFANNYKADLFVSIHANASRSQGARGSEVYFLSLEASDEESRRLAMVEGGLVDGSGGGLAGPGHVPEGRSDVALILWDMAQAEHLEESSALATRLQEELAGVTGSEGRGIKQAPFRVLVGAAMPAVLVEVGFISNAEEERLLTSDEYQAKVVSALVRGLARYQQQREQRRGTSAGAGSRP